MGCVVNGPGESKHADIGISLPGNGEAPVAPVFIDGEHFKTLKGETISLDFIEIINSYIKKIINKRNIDAKNIKGMNDILPPDSSSWKELENKIINYKNYGFQFIKLQFLKPLNYLNAPWVPKQT